MGAGAQILRLFFAEYILPFRRIIFHEELRKWL